ncbi:MAG: DUF11 domain-containing protein [Candidatus Yanofskybacteria bacterium]|nr:DUF11 domain-containing protein [Candidatus Yanofskybacteria bacterium]
MPINKNNLLLLTVSLAIAGMFLFSAPQAWARNPIDIDIGMNLNTLIADHINDLAGRRVVTFVPYSIANTPVSNTNSTGSNLQLSIQKTGKNISKGQTAEQFSLTASPNDTLEFVIRVRSLSSSVLNNVIIRDALPSGLTYINRTTSVNGSITVDGITNYGINIGSLYPNQEIVISFNAAVGQASTFPVGTNQTTNRAEVISDGASVAVAAQLPISITNGQVAGVSTIANVAGVSTGTAGSLALSAALSLFIAFSYMAYTQTGLFRRREALSIIQKHRSDKNRFNFAS